MAAVDRRETESGIEIKPLYTTEDAPREPEPPGIAAVHARDLSRHVPRPAVDDPPVRGLRLGRGVERALPLPARTRARPGSRSRSTCRRSSVSTPTIRAPRARSAGPASRSTRSPTWSCCSTGSRSTDVSTSMTINAPAALLLLLYELVAEEQGLAPERSRGTVQNDILKEYVARGNYIFPPRPSMRLTTDLFAYCAERMPQLEHDLDLRLPHPRGRLDGGPGARVHARERDRLLRGGDRGRALTRRVRRAAVVLLQRAQRLLPGGREVPGGAAALGAR